MRGELGIEQGPLGLVGGSACGAAVLLTLLTLAESKLPVVAAALINPATRASAAIAAGERLFNVTYPWDEARRAKADALDFALRAGGLAEQRPNLPLLSVVGDEDDAAFLEATTTMHESLLAAGWPEERLRLARIEGLAHALAEEPGIEPAPQMAGARQAEEEVAAWFRRFM